MSKIELSVLFKKLQRDNKKEVMEFHVQGDELPNSKEIVLMAGNMSTVEIQGTEVGQISAEFKSIQRDSKKTVLKFEVKGDNDDKIIKLYKYAGSHVTLYLEPSQMSIDDFYAGDLEGAVEVNENQLSIDD